MAAMERHEANGDRHGVAMDSAILAQVRRNSGAERAAAAHQQGRGRRSRSGHHATPMRVSIEVWRKTMWTY
jgi:hypothetical protein